MFRCQYCHNPDTWTLKNGIPVPLERAIDEVRKYASGLRTMGGGFTLSGGEPMMQDRFAARLLAAVKAMGVHTAIETNGFFGERFSTRSCGNRPCHPRHEGIFAGPALRVTAAWKCGRARVRPPSGRTKAADVAALRACSGPDRHSRGDGGVARFGASLGVVERAEILPFHQLGKYKWERLGIEYELAANDPPTQRGVADAVAIFRAAG